MFLNWQSRTFQATLKSSSAMLKSEKWFAILSPLSFSITITSMNLPQTTLYSSAETALMKVKNDLLFWPGLCISPCYLWLKCSLWLCWLVGICPPVLSWFCYFLYLVFSMSNSKCYILSCHARYSPSVTLRQKMMVVRYFPPEKCLHLKSCLDYLFNLFFRN